MNIRNANKETRRFILTTLLVMLLLIITTLYAFVRLNFDRSYPEDRLPPSKQTAFEEVSAEWKSS